jgi:hypothetical protein
VTIGINHGHQVDYIEAAYPSGAKHHENESSDLRVRPLRVCNVKCATELRRHVMHRDAARIHRWVTRDDGDDDDEGNDENDYNDR